MKTILSLLIFLSVTSFAQDENYGENPELCKEKLSIMVTYYRQKAYKDCLPSIRKLMEICPQASKNTYIIGERVYSMLIKETKDEALENKYVDTLILLYDMRMQYFSDKIEDYETMARKGATLGKYRTKDSYEEAYGILNKVVSEAPQVISAYELQIFMYLAKLMVQTKNIDCSVMLDHYFSSSDILSSKTGDDLGNYEKAHQKSIEYADKCLDCGLLDSVYTAGFESHKADTNWLDKGIKILMDKGCKSSTALLTLLETRFDSKPNSETASILGKYYLSTDRTKSETYLNKAIELENDSSKLVNHFLTKAKFHIAGDQYSTARNYASKALKIENNNAEALMLIGDAIAYSATTCKDLKFQGKEVYWIAVDYYNRAASVAVDENIKAAASKKASKFAAYFPEKGDLFLQSLNNGDSYNVGCWINANTTVRAR